MARGWHPTNVFPSDFCLLPSRCFVERYGSLAAFLYAEARQFYNPPPPLPISPFPSTAGTPLSLSPSPDLFSRVLSCLAGRVLFFRVQHPVRLSTTSFCPAPFSVFEKGGCSWLLHRPSLLKLSGASFSIFQPVHYISSIHPTYIPCRMSTPNQHWTRNQQPTRARCATNSSPLRFAQPVLHHTIITSAAPIQTDEQTRRTSDRNRDNGTPRLRTRPHQGRPRRLGDISDRLQQPLEVERLPSTRFSVCIGQRFGDKWNRAERDGNTWSEGPGRCE